MSVSVKLPVSLQNDVFYIIKLQNICTGQVKCERNGLKNVMYIVHIL